MMEGFAAIALLGAVQGMVSGLVMAIILLIADFYISRRDR